jgi:UDP-N-acetylmuramoylalanine--D-glutamate ligase
MIAVFRSKGWAWEGPFGSLEEAVDCAWTRARDGDVVLFSPGATSFEMFKNEFHRGQAFKDLVLGRSPEAE